MEVRTVMATQSVSTSVLSGLSDMPPALRREHLAGWSVGGSGEDARDREPVPLRGARRPRSTP
jgi:hypothetical protein